MKIIYDNKILLQESNVFFFTKHRMGINFTKCLIKWTKSHTLGYFIACVNSYVMCRFYTKKLENLLTCTTREIHFISLSIKST